MKNIITITFFFVAFVLVNCSRNEKNFLLRNKTKQVYMSFEDYKKTVKPVKKNIIKDTTFFVFANNPYKINNKCYISIFVNNNTVFKGLYEDNIKIDLSEFQKKRINISFEVLSLKDKDKYNLYRFSNKSTLYWEKDYNFINVSFFPLNQDVDKVHFFPTKQSIYF